MDERLAVLKTYKLLIDGKFPRSESGRSTPVKGADGAVLGHVSRASRKDLREAVEAARRAQRGWADASAYNRGQVIYRMAEMLEGKSAEMAEALAAVDGSAERGTSRPQRAGERRRGAGRESKAAGDPLALARREVAAAVDRLVAFAGWADKYGQVLGCNNPVAGPYYNFTVPEPTGVVGVISPAGPALLGMISLLAPPLCAGNAVIVLGSERNPLPAAILGEVCATSDVPAGVMNILLGLREELLPQMASHREIDAIHAAGLTAAERGTLMEGAADNLKRVCLRGGTSPAAAGPRAGAGRGGAGGESDIDWFDTAACTDPWWIEPFVEMKTIWHPSGM